MNVTDLLRPFPHGSERHFRAHSWAFLVLGAILLAALCFARPDLRQRFSETWADRFGNFEQGDLMLPRTVDPIERGMRPISTGLEVWQRTCDCYVRDVALRAGPANDGTKIWYVSSEPKHKGVRQSVEVFQSIGLSNLYLNRGMDRVVAKLVTISGIKGKPSAAEVVDWQRFNQVEYGPARTLVVLDHAE